EIQRTANLRGVNERPIPLPNVTGNGTVELTVNDDHTEIQFVLTYTGLNNPVQQAHIHVGSADVAGGIILFYCTNIGGAPAGTVGGQACPPSPATVSGTLKAADLITRAATPTTPAVNTFADVIALLQNGLTYSNVHTATNTGGEIRAQNLPPS